MNQNKIKNYLGYAVGEILLIVIGILIAVSISNHNEKKRQEKVTHGIFNIIVEDIKQDTTEANAILDFYNERKATFLEITDGILTKDEITTCDPCCYLITNRRLFNINKRGFYQLNNYKDLALNDKDPLIFELMNFYTDFIHEIEPTTDRISKDIHENLTFWRDTYPWFAAYIQVQLKKEDRTYFVSQEYRNKVAYHRTLIYNIYIPSMETFKKESEIILKKLNDRLKNQ
ncbi:DUF6090 family protein [Sinomicrobium weinanense]|uniref:Uncharacterized protein n=1 Tax=Sinomicrobium weinanense TaxID=2842200 RepID=A0A926JNI6_9FLAO|nr:DUF6090 family protein [Sinomicrobium weinanense]MBC9794555.1 hypothetical protein [Sinomicrobium weinanense]MBU3124040.1 hypothetical protein [Sinomicrobium weinanense]